ncbi:MAG: RNA-binding protein [Planctomycetaceae bacterium]|nr:RNA-binding protein [Planctomycetaceae bacterium]
MTDDREDVLPDDEYDLEVEERDDAIIGQAFRWSLLAITILVVVGGGTAWWLTRPEEQPEAKERVTARVGLRARSKVEIPAVTFVDVTSQAGIKFTHQNGASGQKLLPETMGGGCAFIDYDGDGDQDLLLVNSQRWPWDQDSQQTPATMHFYRNDGAGTFVDVTVEVGLGHSFYGMGSAVGDYDNDGDQDLFLTAVGANHLYRNDAGKFTEVTAEAGVAGDEKEWSTSCTFFDYNNDGLLDLFVCNYLLWSREIDLAQDFKLTGTDRRAYGKPQSFGSRFPFLYRNDGGGKFSDVSQEMGVHTVNSDQGVPLAKSLGVVAADLDQDGWMDLLVSNDTVENQLFHNQGGQKFTDIGGNSGVSVDSRGQSTGAMGIDVAPFRNNHMLGVAVGNFADEMTSLYIAQKKDAPLQFFDAAVPTGLGPQTQIELTFGLFFFDYDLDGRLDLLAANGHLEDEINKVIESQTYAQPVQLFYNAGTDGATEFVPVPAAKAGADLVRPMVGRGAAYADIDNDGDLDVLVTATGAAPRLLRNDQDLGHHWIRFQLSGSRSNRSGIGARISVHTAGRILPRLVTATRSYLSQSELPVTFGLGSAAAVEKVVIHWPSGAVQELLTPAVDQVHQVNEPE